MVLACLEWMEGFESYCDGVGVMLRGRYLKRL